MRISDWSSDVCSSDLRLNRKVVVTRHEGVRYPRPDADFADLACINGKIRQRIPYLDLEVPTVRHATGTRSAFAQVVCVKFCKLAVMVLVMRLCVVRFSSARAVRPY